MTPEERGEANRQKGIRKEQEANRILKRAFRFSNRVSSYGNNDLFHFADIVGIRRGWPVAFIQVKTNAPKAEPPWSYSWVRPAIDGENAVFQVWNRIDRYGWRIHEYDPESGELPLILDADSCDEDAVYWAVRTLYETRWGEPNRAHWSQQPGGDPE